LTFLVEARENIKSNFRPGKQARADINRRESFRIIEKTLDINGRYKFVKIEDFRRSWRLKIVDNCWSFKAFATEGMASFIRGLRKIAEKFMIYIALLLSFFQ